MSDLIEAFKRQQVEIERFLKVSERYNRTELAAVVVAWLGTERAKQMNDKLEEGE